MDTPNGVSLELLKTVAELLLGPILRKTLKPSVLSLTECHSCQERMALGLGATSYGLTSYELLFFNTDHQMYVYKI
jgi:hypothetical protein